MKNLNVKLAKNFKVELYEIGVNIPREDEIFDVVISYAEKFLTNLAKKNIFPETEDIICIDDNLSKSIFGKQLILNFRIEKAKFIYDFNNCAELESLRIENLFLAI